MATGAGRSSRILGKRKEGKNVSGSEPSSTTAAPPGSDIDVRRLQKISFCSKGLSSVQSLSRVLLFATPWTAACQASLSSTNSWSLLKLMSIASVILSNHLILCHPLPSPPSIRVFSSESVLHIRRPKLWSFSFSISPSNLGLVSFRIDGLDFFAVQALAHY